MARRALVNCRWQHGRVCQVRRNGSLAINVWEPLFRGHWEAASKGLAHRGYPELPVPPVPTGLNFDIDCKTPTGDARVALRKLSADEWRGLGHVVVDVGEHDFVANANIALGGLGRAMETNVGLIILNSGRRKSQSRSLQPILGDDDGLLTFRQRAMAIPTLDIAARFVAMVAVQLSLCNSNTAFTSRALYYRTAALFRPPEKRAKIELQRWHGRVAALLNFHEAAAYGYKVPPGYENMRVYGPMSLGFRLPSLTMAKEVDDNSVPTAWEDYHQLPKSLPLALQSRPRVRLHLAATGVLVVEKLSLFVELVGSDACQAPGPLSGLVIISSNGFAKAPLLPLLRSMAHAAQVRADKFNIPNTWNDMDFDGLVAACCLDQAGLRPQPLVLSPERLAAIPDSWRAWASPFPGLHEPKKRSKLSNFIRNRAALVDPDRDEHGAAFCSPELHRKLLPAMVDVQNNGEWHLDHLPDKGGVVVEMVQEADEGFFDRQHQQWGSIGAWRQPQGHTLKGGFVGEFEKNVLLTADGERHTSAALSAAVASDDSLSQHRRKRCVHTIPGSSLWTLPQRQVIEIEARRFAADLCQALDESSESAQGCEFTPRGSLFSPYVDFAHDADLHFYIDEHEDVSSAAAKLVEKAQQWGVDSLVSVRCKRGIGETFEDVKGPFTGIASSFTMPGVHTVVVSGLWQVHGYLIPVDLSVGSRVGESRLETVDDRLEKMQAHASAGRWAKVVQQCRGLLGELEAQQSGSGRMGSRRVQLHAARADLTAKFAYSSLGSAYAMLTHVKTAQGAFDGDDELVCYIRNVLGAPVETREEVQALLQLLQEEVDSGAKVVLRDILPAVALSLPPAHRDTVLGLVGND